MYVMLKWNSKLSLETNVESMCKCYVVPFCKFHSFIGSIQGEVLCWFHINSTNFACWEKAYRYLRVATWYTTSIFPQEYCWQHHIHSLLRWQPGRNKLTYWTHSQVPYPYIVTILCHETTPFRSFGMENYTFVVC